MPRKRAQRATVARIDRLVDSSHDLLDVYIDELGRLPVLSAEDQKALARRLRDTRRSRAEREAAREQLIEANLRFAFSIAKQYQNRGLPLEDLISEANAGLVRAADKYDPDVGVNFISYAVWWIRQALFSAIASKSRTVRVPLNRAGDLSRVSRAQAILRDRLHREPTPEEIGEVASLAPDVVHDLLVAMQPDRSLDEPLASRRGGEQRSMGEVLNIAAADDEEDTDTLPAGLEQSSTREAIFRALEAIPPRDRKVLILYYGLAGEEPLTLDSIAQRFGITRERVRQLRDRALRAIREGGAAAVLRAEWAA